MLCSFQTRPMNAVLQVKLVKFQFLKFSDNEWICHYTQGFPFVESEFWGTGFKTTFASIPDGTKTHQWNSPKLTLYWLRSVNVDQVAILYFSTSCWRIPFEEVGFLYWCFLHHISPEVLTKWVVWLKIHNHTTMLQWQIVMNLEPFHFFNKPGIHSFFLVRGIHLWDLSCLSGSAQH